MCQSESGNQLPRESQKKVAGKVADFRRQKRFSGEVRKGEKQWMRKERKPVLRKPKKRKEGIIYTFILKNINAFISSENQNQIDF